MKNKFLMAIAIVGMELGLTSIVVSAIMGLSMGCEFSPECELMPTYMCIVGLVLSLIGIGAWTRTESYKDYWE